MQPNLFDSFNYSFVENCTLCTVHWQTVLSQVLALRKRVVTEGDYVSDVFGASKVNTSARISFWPFPLFPLSNMYKLMI